MVFDTIFVVTTSMAVLVTGCLVTDLLFYFLYKKKWKGDFNLFMRHYKCHIMFIVSFGSFATPQ